MFFNIAMLVLALSCESSSQSIGLGVYHFQPSTNSMLQIFDSPESAQPQLTFAVLFKNDSMLFSVADREVDDKIDLQPLYYNSKLATLSLQVISNQGNWHKVVLNNSIPTYGWIELDASEIESWETFLKTIHHITPKGSLLLKSMHSKKSVAYNSYFHCLRVKGVYLNWIEVAHTPEFCPDKKRLFLEGPGGFLKWKDGQKLMIEFRM